MRDIIKTGIQEKISKTTENGCKDSDGNRDNPHAKYNAGIAGVDDYIAGKARKIKMNYIIEEQRLRKKLVAMMGDGTNDAPACAGRC